jgi:hypothetical protein
MEFIPTSETARTEVLDYAREQIRVYGVDLETLPDDHNIWDSSENFITEAEAQGLVWSLKGFELQANNDQINFNNIFIKII